MWGAEVGERDEQQDEQTDYARSVKAIKQATRSHSEQQFGAHPGGTQ